MIHTQVYRYKSYTYTFTKICPTHLVHMYTHIYLTHMCTDMTHMYKRADIYHLIYSCGDTHLMHTCVPIYLKPTCAKTYISHWYMYTDIFLTDPCTKDNYLTHTVHECRTTCTSDAHLAYIVYLAHTCVQTYCISDTYLATDICTSDADICTYKHIFDRYMCTDISDTYVQRYSRCRLWLSAYSVADSRPLPIVSACTCTALCRVGKHAEDGGGGGGTLVADHVLYRLLGVNGS